MAADPSATANVVTCRFRGHRAYPGSGQGSDRRGSPAAEGAAPSFAARTSLDGELNVNAKSGSPRYEHLASERG